MSNKQFNARMQQKIDTQENWEKATNFIPLKGEIIIYDIDANNTTRRIKIGDGITNVNDLDFFSPSSNNQNIETEIIEGSTNAVSSGAVYNALQNVDAKMVNGYQIRVSTEIPTSEEVNDQTITFII